MTGPDPVAILTARARRLVALWQERADHLARAMPGDAFAHGGIVALRECADELARAMGSR